MAALVDLYVTLFIAYLIFSLSVKRNQFTK